MKIQLLSDIHIEFHRDNGKSFIDSLIPQSDILVLAGDICSLKRYNPAKEVYSAFCAKYKTVIEVLGNHSYYGSDFQNVNRNALKLQQDIKNLHILEMGFAKAIDGRRWVGGTLWFKEDPMNYLYSSGLNDFRAIRNFVPAVYRINRTTVEKLELHVETGDVVVTHHMPSYQCINPKFKGDDLNRFFANNLDELIIRKKPAVWFCGHTHDPVDIKVGDTRIYANPLGYLGEGCNPNWEERSFIDIA